MKAKVTSTNTLRILLADDDKDDHFFLSQILKELDIPTELISIHDGEKLIGYLTKNSDHLPDFLFLDLNMPRKNGPECLREIKRNPKLKHLPVIIYSTSFSDQVVDELYKDGAHCCIRKADFEELKDIIGNILNLMIEQKFRRCSRDEFILNIVNV